MELPTQAKPLAGTRILLWSVYAYILSFAVEGWYNTTLLGNHFLLPELFILTVFFVGTGCYMWQRPRWRLLVLDVAVLLYAATVGISYLYSGEARALGEVLAIGHFGLLYGLLSYLIPRSHVPKLLTVLVCSASLAAGIAVISWLLQQLGIDNAQVHFFPSYPLLGDVYRAEGFFRSPILLADFIGVGILLVAIHFQFRPAAIWSTKRILTLTLLLGVGLFLTFTKSILLIFGGLLAGWWTLHPLPAWFRRTLQLSVGILVGIYLFSSHAFLKRTDSPNFATFLQSQYSSSTYVPITSDSAWVLIPSIYTTQKQACILEGNTNFPFGIGGNVHVLHAKQLFEEGHIPKYGGMTPHSTYFGAYGELGFIGLMALLYLFYTLWRAPKRLYKGQGVNDATYVGMRILLIYIFLQAVTMDCMNIRHYWILLIVLAVYLRTASSSYEKSGID